MNGRRDALRSPGAAILVVVLALIAITGQLLGVASSGVHVYDPDRVDTSSILATATNTPADQDDLERRDSATEGAVGYDDGSQLARARPGEYRSAPNTGSISYGVLDDLGRPTGVTARLTPDMIGAGSSAARSITPPGFGGGAAGHARGHLLGNQLGGSGADARNLVTMFQNPANSPVMRGFENQVRAALDAGQVVNYGATPIYRSTGLMPVGITLRAQGSGGLDFFLSVLNRGL